MRIFTTIKHHFLEGIGAGENLLLNRNIFLAVSICAIVLFLEVVVLVQVAIGMAETDQLPKVLISTIGVLIPLYLFFIKKNTSLAIQFLVSSALILELGMLITYFEQDPYTHIIWAQILTFPVVLMLGFRQSRIVMPIYSLVLAVMVYVRIDDTVGSRWQATDFNQFVLTQTLILCFALLSEWTVENILTKLQLARKQEKVSAEKHAAALRKVLDNKKQLLINVAHELRTPLTVLKTSVEAMEDGVNDHTESYQLLHQKVAQIDSLIEDIYLISQYDSEQLSVNTETIHIAEIGGDIQRSFRHIAESKNLTLNIDSLLNSDIYISGDWQRLTRVFNNLINNSIHYTDEGGSIEITTLVIHPMVEITVHDSFPGVPEKEKVKLFDRFYRRESSRNRDTGGSGLGLTISKAVVEAHGGKIGLANSPLGGLAVACRFPMIQM